MIHFYLNNTLILRPLTSQIITCNTHKMAIVSYRMDCDVTLPHVYVVRACQSVTSAVPVQDTLK